MGFMGNNIGNLIIETWWVIYFSKDFFGQLGTRIQFHHAPFIENVYLKLKYATRSFYRFH